MVGKLHQSKQSVRWFRSLLPILLVLVLLVPLLEPTTIQAATLPSGFNESEFVRGLDRPTSMEFAPDGRLFVTQKYGALRVVKNGELLPTPFVTVNNVDSYRERGLLGVAFDPNFATNQYVYVRYVSSSPSCHHVVSRFTANGDVAVPGSEVVLWTTSPCGSGGHNGGALHFGNDGKLYISLGEQNISSNSQSLSNQYGKILRLNADGTIPTDNPFYTTATGANRSIWVLGLRNPFTFAVQPGSGRIFVNDVGNATWEEINDAVAGKNYGWPNCEGDCSPANPQFVDPEYSYRHGVSNPGECAIVGGSFYNPQTVQFPNEYVGDYFFADYCSNYIKRYDPTTGVVNTLATNALLVGDLKVGNDGSLYYLTRNGGSTGSFVYKISYSNLPAVQRQPSNLTIDAGNTASFNVLGSGTPILKYQWQRRINGTWTNIANATTKTHTFRAAAADNGAAFRCVVTNDAGSAVSKAATLTVVSTVNNPPVAEITQPTADLLYTGGMIVQYAGTGTDEEDGTLPASAYTWEVDFHHDTHIHPFIDPFSGVTSGSFRIPNNDETAHNVWYRIYLTVTDSGGESTTVSTDVYPRKSTLKFETSPPGLQIALEGQPMTTPFQTQSVIGVRRQLGPVANQVVNGTTMVFDSWSDGGQPVHYTITRDAPASTFTAFYRPASGSVGTGTGLRGTYYDNLDFTGTQVSRTDRTVYFNWGSGTPAPGIGVDTFSVRWRGSIQPQFSEAYTLYTVTNDGVRLRVNGQVLIDDWTSHPLTQKSATFTFVAGEKYDIVMEYFDNAGSATAQLMWASPSTPKSAVPSSQLYPTP